MAIKGSEPMTPDVDVIDAGQLAQGRTALERAVSIAQNQLGEAISRRETASTRFLLGEATKEDVRAAMADVERAEVALEEARTTLGRLAEALEKLGEQEWQRRMAATFARLRELQPAYAAAAGRLSTALADVKKANGELQNLWQQIEAAGAGSPLRGYCVSWPVPLADYVDARPFRAFWAAPDSRNLPWDKVKMIDFLTAAFSRPIELPESK